MDNPNNPNDPVICPARITPELEKQIRQVRFRSYKALGCVDLCRMDIRLDASGVPNVIDVNALPGLMPDPLENSRFPKSCFTAGMSYDEIIWNVMSAACARHGIRKPIYNAIKGDTK
jgi:D-alanine-D-alanine ligase